VAGVIRPKHPFPWRSGNAVALLVDGAKFYPRMLEALQAARRRISVEMYLVESGRVADRFIAVLEAAAARGVEVRLLLDDFGALGLRATDRRRLSAAGAQLRFYNPLRLRRWAANFARDHRKLVIVDDAVAYTGGAGLSDEFDPPDAAAPWRETMVEVRGPVVADWAALFGETWSRHTALPSPEVDASVSPVAGKTRARVTIGRGVREQGVKRSCSHGSRRRGGGCGSRPRTSSRPSACGAP